MVSGVQSQVSSVFSDLRSYCQVDTPEAAAMAKCQAGDYQAGIPVLEDSLISNKIPLPAPGYRWPGRPI